MTIHRRVDICTACGNPKQIVSGTLCAACNMARRREAERRGEPIHNPSQHTYLRELNKYSTRIIKASSLWEDEQIPDTFVSAIDYELVKRIFREAIEKITATKKEYEHKPVMNINPESEVDETEVLEVEEERL